MFKPLDVEIARKCFATLVLDYESPDYASGRVLIDGWYKATLTANNREELIQKFYNKEY